jgi:hypothetical protein
MNETQTVWVLSHGSGEDGDEWGLLGIYPTREECIAAGDRYKQRGSWASVNEPWEVAIGDDIF